MSFSSSQDSNGCLLHSNTQIPYFDLQGPSYSCLLPHPHFLRFSPFLILIKPHRSSYRSSSTQSHFYSRASATTIVSVWNGHPHRSSMVDSLTSPSPAFCSTSLCYAAFSLHDFQERRWGYLILTCYHVPIRTLKDWVLYTFLYTSLYSNYLWIVNQWIVLRGYSN